MENRVKALNEAMQGKEAAEVVAFFLEKYKSKVALASSLGLEDQVLTDMMLRKDRQAKIFTIDTGRLFPETYSLIDRTNMHYGVRLEVYFPQCEGVETFVRQHGMNGFYEGVEQRKAC
jgi:phosphoadenosine phosphosulfate reductase